MRKDGFHMRALVAIFILALALKLFFVTGEPLVYNNDAGYYVEHIQEVLRQGYPDVRDPPIPFYYAGLFAAFLGVMLGFKVAISIASAAIAFPVYKITEHIGKKRDAALLAAFLAAFSPTNMFMMGDLLKNMLGLFFGAWFVYFLIKATDRFSMRDAALAAISMALMVGSHLSSSGYIVFTLAPFLALLPIYKYRKGWKLGKESLFCVAMAGLLLAAGAAAILYRGLSVGEGKIGTVGLHGNSGQSLGLFTEYLIFVPFVLLGMRRLKAERLLLFVPWLLMTLLLSQPFFTQPAWESRFIWDAYFMVAVLSALGIGYFRKDKAAYCGLITILAAYSLAGFAHSGQDIGPIIYEEEWEGLLALNEERPDIVFGMVEGGMAQWVNAAGFETAPTLPRDGYLLLCDRSEPQPDRWLAGGCMMATSVERQAIDQSAPIARFGRFYVVPAEGLPQIPQEDGGIGWGAGPEAEAPPIINPG